MAKLVFFKKQFWYPQCCLFWQITAGNLISSPFVIWHRLEYCWMCVPLLKEHKDIRKATRSTWIILRHFGTQRYMRSMWQTSWHAQRKKNRLREGHEETKVSSEENIWGVNLEKLRVESITWDWELHYGEVDKIVYILFFTRGNKHCHW